MKVLLLAGGSSSERSVSLRSGRAMFEALVRLGHGTAAYDPATAEYLSDGSAKYLLPDNLDAFVASKDSLRQLTDILQGSQRPEVVLSALHGGSGEGGQVQAILELSGVPFVGSSMAASAITMDKSLTKHLMRSIGVPTADWKLVGGRVDMGESIVNETSTLGFPFIVKPNDGGSTVGLTKVTKRDDILPAIALSRKQAPRTICESFIAGRELTATILHGRALPLVEIRPKNELYDFEAKYTKGKSDYLCPAPIDEKMTLEIQRCAASLYETAGCWGIARADFMLRDDGKFFCLEINTLPGMTELSLAPMAAAAVGIPFDALISVLLTEAVKTKHQTSVSL
jgi:D-alanine-D-alanine ligase